MNVQPSTQQTRQHKLSICSLFLTAILLQYTHYLVSMHPHRSSSKAKVSNIMANDAPSQASGSFGNQSATSGSINVIKKPKVERAHWNVAETRALLEYLNDHKSEGGDGLNFKATTYRAAAAHINALAIHTHGAIKTGDMCSRKWVGVRYHLLFLYYPKLINIDQLKQIYNAIESYRSNSGVHWDIKYGASIRTEEEKAVWKDFATQKVNFFFFGLYIDQLYNTLEQCFNATL